MIFTVSDATELANAFLQATDGDRIELLPGEYDATTLRDRDFETAITITSADPTNPADFRGALTLRDASGVDITHLGFAPNGNALDILDLVLIQGAQNITLNSNTFVGHIATAEQGLPAAEEIDTREKAKGLIEGQAFARGVRATDSENITLIDNTFSDLRKGIILDTVQQVEITGNHLHDLRSDGINLVDAVSVTIAKNLMESFHPLHNYNNIAYADHGDFIQWWAGDGGLGIRDLTIRDNALLQGSGSWVQGIFGRSGSANPDGSPAEFDGIRIENNLIHTSHTNGIFIGDARNVDIIGNTLLPAPQDLTQPVITSGIPTIHIRTSASRIDAQTYDVSERGAVPQDISVEENLVVGEHAFTSYLIDPEFYAQLNITQASNTVLSADSASPQYWGSLFPEIVSVPLVDPMQISTAATVGGVDPVAMPTRLLELLSNPSRQTDGIQAGTQTDDFIQADGSGRIVDAAAGDDVIEGTQKGDVLRGGVGSDRTTTGAGADRVAIHRSDMAFGDADVIVDLDFEAGDHLVFSGGFGSGYFNDAVDPNNAMTTFRSGDSAIIHDRADLIELIAQVSVSAHAVDSDGIALRFDLDGDVIPDWSLTLQGISDVGEVSAPADAAGQSLIGTSQADTLSGGDGNDWIDGQGGSDVLAGGAGADVFVVSGVSIGTGAHVNLVDFSFLEGDWIELIGIPTPGGHSGTHSLVLDSIAALEAASSSGVAVFSTTSQSTVISLDLDHDSRTDAILTLGEMNETTEGFSEFGVLLGSATSDVLLSQGLTGHDLFGFGGNDLLIGQSELDRLFGGAGDDRFYVSAQGMHAAEAAGEGYDRVYTSVNYTLGANVEAISANAAGSLRLTGNAQDNWITGNGDGNVLSGKDGNDRLIGLEGRDWLDGGRGADILQGGLGDDRYVVDAAGDRVLETANQGYDRVYTTIDFTLGVEIEAMNAWGTDDLQLTGNEVGNWVTGNAGNNVVHGMAGNDRLSGMSGDDVLIGGTGRDVLEGGEGRDVFSFSAGDDLDMIMDFEAGSDMLLLDVLSEIHSLAAVETSTGVMISYGAPGDAVVLQGMTQAMLQQNDIFADGQMWVLDF